MMVKVVDAERRRPSSVESSVETRADYCAKRDATRRRDAPEMADEREMISRKGPLGPITAAALFDMGILSCQSCDGMTGLLRLIHACTSNSPQSQSFAKSNEHAIRKSHELRRVTEAEELKQEGYQKAFRQRRCGCLDDFWRCVWCNG